MTNTMLTILIILVPALLAVGFGIYSIAAFLNRENTK